MAQVQITAADVTDADMELFSDMWKDCYNFRPRFTATKQDYADLMNHYDDIQEQICHQEEAELQHLRDTHGVNFANMMAYYDWEEAQYFVRQAAKEAARKEAAELRKPGIKAIIDQWEHGDQVCG